MSSNHPRHIAIILDGNRRYAKRHSIPLLKGHEHGMSKIHDLMRWMQELDIKELTLYCFSTENFNRSKQEVNALFTLFRKEFENFRDNKQIREHGIRLNPIGRLEMFPREVRQSLLSIKEKTRLHNKHIINFCLAYGGRQEITDAVNTLIKKHKNSVSEQDISGALYLSSEPDIIIRPGGETRVSNFLIWQGSYAEWFFLKKLWPEFTKTDLKRIIADFKKRQRRFGT